MFGKLLERLCGLNPNLGALSKKPANRPMRSFARYGPTLSMSGPYLSGIALYVYLGHVEAFDWNLIDADTRLTAFPFTLLEFDHLFAFGIDPPPGQLPDDRLSDWPSLAEVDRYNQRVRDEIDDLIDEVPPQLLHVAVEHRLMHAETFAYILHQLDYGAKDLAPATAPRVGACASLTNREMVEIPARERRLQLGLDCDAAFGWDNEFQALAAEVPLRFSMARHKITNGEYLEFVRQPGAGCAFLLGRTCGPQVSSRHGRGNSAAARLAGLRDAQ